MLGLGPRPASICITGLQVACDVGAPELDPSKLSLVWGDAEVQRRQPNISGYLVRCIIQTSYHSSSMCIEQLIYTLMVLFSVTFYVSAIYHGPCSTMDRR
jgi:hypothetical protein